MRKSAMALRALAIGGGSGGNGGGEAQKVAVLLPDTKSSVRWETATTTSKEL